MRRWPESAAAPTRRVDRDLASDARGLRGYIRVFANASAIAEFLPASIVSFLADPKNTDIDVQIEEMSSADIVSGVRGGLAALGICRTETEASGTGSRTTNPSNLIRILVCFSPWIKYVWQRTLPHSHAGTANRRSFVPLAAWSRARLGACRLRRVTLLGRCDAPRGDGRATG